MAHERTVAVLEARMGSSRLPGKSMMPLAGKPLVECVLDRLSQARSLDHIVLATSTAERDSVLAELGARKGVGVFRGSETDVLGRILGASHSANAAIHVQCWGDCPFLDAGEVDRVVDAILSTGADVAGNGLGSDRRLPYGLDIIAVRVSALERADVATRDDPYHREHGTTYLYQHPELFRVAALPTPDGIGYPGLDLTINTDDDYRFVDEVYGLLGPRSSTASTLELIELIRSTPTLLAHPKAAALRSDPSTGA